MIVSTKTGQSFSLKLPATDRSLPAKSSLFPAHAFQKAMLIWGILFFSAVLHAQTTLTYYNLQYPPTATIAPGGSVTVYAQVYEGGLTEAGGAAPGVSCWIGYSSNNVNPSDPSFTWVAATYNTQSGNNDEYQATIGSNLSSGTYYYASRFQRNGGQFYYGGTQGSWGGSSISGVLTVTAVVNDFDYYNLQYPFSANIVTGNNVTVYAQVYKSGLTEAGGAPAGVSCWIGYSSSNVNPADPSFTWVPATYNTQSGNNDEYKAAIGGNLPAGTYYYASRWQLNAGSYYYGGTGGAWGGSSVSGILTITNAAPDFDYYNIQFPLTATIQTGGSTTVYAQVYKSGLTEAGGAPVGVSCWIGYSSTNTNPSDPSFTWVAASYNTQAGSNDEYQATIGSNLPAGTYYYASRWQLNAGSFYYGGTQGPWGGASISGVLTVNAPSTTLAYYNLQFPATANIQPGGSATVYAQVYEQGVTEAAGADAGISCWIGYSSTNTNPSGPSFTWVAATYNSQSGNNDEYKADIGSNLAVGTYYYASRFQHNGGAYYYGGTQGAWGGSSISGVLTVACTIPAPVITVTGSSSFCATGSVLMNSNAATGNTWRKNGTDIPGANGISYTATDLGVYTVFVTNQQGCTGESAPLTLLPGTISAPVITGPVNVCQYIGTGTPVTYTFNAPAATYYSFSIPANVNLVSNTANSITVTFTNGFATQNDKQIRVTASGASCFTSSMSIYYLLAQAPVTPAPITGNTNVCSIIGTPQTYTYSVPPVTGATGYAWTAQAGTTTITHPNGPGVNDHTIEVSFANGFTTSAITVQAVNGCGTSNARSITVVKAIPSTPSPIIGPVNVCANIAPGGTTAFYSVIAVAGNTYNWTVPAGAIGLSGQGTAAISFVYPNGFTGGTLSVTATNGCGTSAARSLAVSRLNPSAPSTIDVIQTQLCPDRVYTYTLAGMPANAVSIQWTVPAAALSFTGQGTTSITVSYPSTAVTGNVTAQAVSNCGNSTIRTVAVKLAACQDVPPPPPPPFAKAGTVPVTTMVSAEAMLVNVFPNPTVSDFKLQVLTAGRETIRVRVLDMQGRELKNLVVSALQITNIGSDLGAGAYIMEVKQGNTVKTTKLLKFSKH